MLGWDVLRDAGFDSLTGLPQCWGRATRIHKAKKRTAKAFLEVEFRCLSHAIKQLRDSQKHKGWQASTKQKNTIGMKIE